MVQRQTNGPDSAKLLWVPEAQKDDGTQLHFKRCPGLWLVHYKSSHSLNKAVSCNDRHVCYGSFSHRLMLKKALTILT